jgi:hypothetical protein
LKDFIYSVNEVDMLTAPKRRMNVTTVVPRDAKLDAINWNEDRITDCWFVFLDILGNLNKINEPGTHSRTVTSRSL